jgi:hypothetical protein
MAWRRGAPVAVLVAVVLLSGCSSSITSDLAQSVSQALSSAQTARTTLIQWRGGRLLDGVSSTAFEDMLREAQDAETTAQATTPPTSAQRTLRDRVLPLLHATTAAVVTAQDVTGQIPGAPSAATALRRLDVVVQRLQDANRRLGSGR